MNYMKKDIDRHLHFYSKRLGDNVTYDFKNNTIFRDDDTTPKSINECNIDRFEGASDQFLDAFLKNYFDEQMEDVINE